MMSRNVARVWRSNNCVNVVNQNRSFIFTAGATVLGSLIFGEEARLANKMERGELHYDNSNAALNLSQDPRLFVREEPNYPGHVPLYWFEKLVLMAGSSMGAYFHPERNEFIVALGESTAFPFILRKLRDQMLSDPVGRQILQERPRITSTSLDLEYLKTLPESTVGKNYYNWLDKEGVSPDTRVAVKFIDDEELAYVFQRYRECHDFYHAITGLPIIIEGEIAVKVLEFMNIGIPMTGLGSLFAPWRLKKSQRKRLFEVYYPWAMKNGLNSKPLINVYWEKLLTKDINELRRELGIAQPPDLRGLRKQYFADLKKMKTPSFPAKQIV